MVFSDFLFAGWVYFCFIGEPNFGFKVINGGVLVRIWVLWGVVYIKFDIGRILNKL